MNVSDEAWAAQVKRADDAEMREASAYVGIAQVLREHDECVCRHCRRILGNVLMARSNHPLWAELTAPPLDALPTARAGEMLSEPHGESLTTTSYLERVGRPAALLFGAEPTADELRRAGAAYARKQKPCACTGVYHHGECPMRAMTP